MENKKTLKGFRDYSSFEYSKRLARWEYEVSTFNGDGLEDEQHKIMKYIMSTNLRWRFSLTAILTAMDGVYLQLACIRKELGASRAAIDTMVNELEEAGWLLVKRDKKNHRSVQASELTVKTWIKYCRWASLKSAKHDLSFHGLLVNRVHSS